MMSSAVALVAVAVAVGELAIGGDGGGDVGDSVEVGEAVTGGL